MPPYQKKRHRDQCNRKTKAPRRGRRARRHSPSRHDTSSPAPSPGVCRESHTPRGDFLKLILQESCRTTRAGPPDIDFTRLPPVPQRALRLPTPPPTSDGRSEVTPQRGMAPFPFPRARDQDDDTASQGSMTTRVGDRDGETLPSNQDQDSRTFDYDWADEGADKPPVPWEDIPSYTDFHDNKRAHNYWQWDRSELKWRHVDAETGEVVFCSSELD